ncbi:MAG TPA: glycosyltransferase family 1 protein [Thermoanaerobaculia bacterium]|nr:glycosyltransferase family 1 protein [Thermoanaerobaculia bacterium]
MRIGIDARKIADFGIGTYIRGLLRGLEEIGAPEEYVVFAPSPVSPRFEHVPFDAPHYSARELIDLGRAIKKARLDLFHAPHYVVPFTGTPVVVTIHDLIHLHAKHRNPLKPLYARTMLGRAVRKSARVLTVSEAVKRDIVATFGCAEEHVVVTPNGIDPQFTLLRHSERSRGTWVEGGAPATRPGPSTTLGMTGNFFLFVGNDKPHKNVDALVDAFARVRIARPDLRLVLAGAPFARFAQRDGVECIGFVDDLAPLYRGALAVVVPSIEEGFGLPAAEAMACGAAVITSHAAALVEVTGDAAIHTNDFADAMLRVASDDALRRELAHRGIARAASFTWSSCAEKTRRVYLTSAF